MASLRDTQTIFNLLDAQHLKNIILKNTSSDQYCWSCLENSTSLRGYYLINCLSKITVLNLNSNKAKSKRELIFFFWDRYDKISTYVLHDDCFLSSS